MSGAGGRGVKRGRPRKDWIPEDDYFERIRLDGNRFRYQCCMCPEYRSSVPNIRVHLKTCDPVQAAIHDAAHANADGQAGPADEAEADTHEGVGVPQRYSGPEVQGDAALSGLGQHDAFSDASQHSASAAGDDSDVISELGSSLDMDTSSSSASDDDGGSLSDSASEAGSEPGEPGQDAEAEQPAFPEENAAEDLPALPQENRANHAPAVHRRWFPRPTLETTGAVSFRS